ncbi:MAG: hypothetical protein HY060_07485 [Proteobacteria bacterium]|nr:hypothetical protein [Pseudomonadota bacterium]
MSPWAEQLLLDATRWVLAGATLALVGFCVVFYVWFDTPTPACGTDIVKRVGLPNSMWVVEETQWNCSTLGGGLVHIVARNARTTIVLAELSDLVDLELTPLGSDRVAITMPDPDDTTRPFSASYLFTAEPVCAAEGLTVEYRFRSYQDPSSPPRPYSCTYRVAR